MTEVVEKRGPVTVVTLARREVRNAVDSPHAAVLLQPLSEASAGAGTRARIARA
jgi:enoyl-CoA hydratase/carnithine racemase